MSLLPNFNESQLPERFRAPWDKANEILMLHNHGIVDAPGVTLMKIVASLSESKNPRNVIYNAEFNKASCTCPGYTKKKTCGHIFAVSFVQNKLEKYFSTLMYNLIEQMESTFPKTMGRKPSNVKRKQKPPQVRDISDYDDPLQVINSSVPPVLSDDGFTVMWVKEERCTVCYGCGGSVRSKPSDPPPPPPYDLMLKGKERRSYIAKGTKQFYDTKGKCFLPFAKEVYSSKKIKNIF